MKKIVILFTIISIVAKIIAFARELMLSYNYGAGQISDVFLLSITLPVTVFGFVLEGVISGFIPIYINAKIEVDENRACIYTSNVITFLCIVCACFVCLYFGFSDQIIKVLAFGFDTETASIAKQFTNISIWTIFFTAIVTVLSGYLQVNDYIKITALVSVPMNIGLVIAIFISCLRNDIYILPLGFLISSCVQALLIIYISNNVGFRFICEININDKYLRRFISSLLLLMLSSSLQQINILIDRTLATTVAVGGLSLYEYGSKINDLIIGLSIVPITTSLFPFLTKSKSNMNEFGKIINEGMKLVSIIIIPITIVVILYSDVIVEIIYSRGAFGSDEVQCTSEIVMFYGVGLLALSYRSVFLKCLYAVGCIKESVFNSSIGIICNIGLNFIFLKMFGLGGLALATSVSIVIAAILLYFSLKRVIKEINIKGIIKKSMFLFTASSICGYVSLAVHKFLLYILGIKIICFVIAVVIFIILYFITMFLTGITTIDEMKKWQVLKRGNNEK